MTQLLKKGSLILGLLPFFLATSCMSDPTQYGRVVQRNAVNKDLFIFSVKQEYVTQHQDSPKDKKNPKLTKAESKLLYKLLKQQRYCVNEKGNIAFTITSKQEKIYDMTFASLIEESYNARPLTPLMYYGQCLNKNNTPDIKGTLQKVKDEVGKLK